MVLKGQFTQKFTFWKWYIQIHVIPELYNFIYNAGQKSRIFLHFYKCIIFYNYNTFWKFEVS